MKKPILSILLLASLGVMGQSKGKPHVLIGGDPFGSNGDVATYSIDGIAINLDTPKTEKPKTLVYDENYGFLTGGHSEYNTPKPDTVQSYFKEITGVKDGELVTQWVKGFKVVNATISSQNYWVYGNGQPVNPIITNTFLYPDKTKVSNIIIQSY
jgi:hypothetical protein